MRLIKSPREIELMRRAGRLTARGLVEGRSDDANRASSNLNWLPRQIFCSFAVVRGDPVIDRLSPGAPTSGTRNYYRNDQLLQSGDLVLMDYAPDVNGYTSDIGRMWPVDGSYSPVQGELYGFVVEYQKILLKTIRPSMHVGENRFRPRLSR